MDGPFAKVEIHCCNSLSIIAALHHDKTNQLSSDYELFTTAATGGDVAKLIIQSALVRFL